jgi:hypothetical protein
MTPEETEEQMIVRVAKRMFGDNLALTPQVIEMIKPLYRRYLEDMKEKAA